MFSLTTRSAMVAAPALAGDRLQSTFLSFHFSSNDICNRNRNDNCKSLFYNCTGGGRARAVTTAAANYCYRIYKTADSPIACCRPVHKQPSIHPVSQLLALSCRRLERICPTNPSPSSSSFTPTHKVDG